MHTLLTSLRFGTMLVIAALTFTNAQAQVRLTGMFVFSCDRHGNPAGDFVWDTRGLDSDFYKVFVTDGLAGPFLNGPTWGEATLNLELTPGDHVYTIWFQENGPWNFFAMNLFFDDSLLPDISVKAPLITAQPGPRHFSANRAPVTYTMTSYPTADGPAAGTLIAELAQRVKLTSFYVLDSALLNTDRVDTHNVVPNGRADLSGTFTLSVSE